MIYSVMIYWISKHKLLALFSELRYVLLSKAEAPFCGKKQVAVSFTLF